MAVAVPERTLAEAPNLISVQEAADFLGVSRGKVRRLIKDGSLTRFDNPLDKRYVLVNYDEVVDIKERSRLFRKP